MNHNHHFERILLICSFNLVLVTALWSQTPRAEQSFCAYVENSDVIFVGNLIAIGDSAAKPSGTSLSRYSVIRPLKGKVRANEKVSAAASGHRKKLGPGGPYLVFLRTDSFSQKIIAVSFPVTFIDGGRSKSHSKRYQIAFGDIPSGNADDLRHFNVSVTANGKRFKPTFVQGGIFVTVFDRRIQVFGTIEADLPVDVSIVGSPLAEVRQKSGRTIVKYELNEANQNCQYREFTFYRR